MAKLVIRKMSFIDINEVSEVDQASFSIPWPKETFLQEITQNDYAHYYVAELDHKVIGYIGMWIVVGDAQITNVAVSPDWRGYKIGEKLFQYACEQAIRMGSERLSLEVRASNTVAQRMYRKFGLVPGGIRKKYYTDNQEDAIVMWVNLR